MAAVWLGAGLTISASVASADPVKPEPLSPELIAAAKQEGKVVWYESLALPVSTKVAKAFEAAYPGMSVQIEYAAAEETYRRIMLEYGGGIKNVDVASAGADNSYSFKTKGMLAQYVPEIETKYPDKVRDPDGTSIGMLTGLMVIAYNTKLVKPEDAPKGFADLLDPKWKDKLVKADPNYSGAIMAGTYLVAHTLGWEYYKKLATLNVLQQKSAQDPPRIVAQGERAAMADGTENAVIRLMKSGEPIKIVYPVEGSPGALVTSEIMKEAPHANAARLFLSFLLDTASQQIISDGGYDSFNPDVVLNDGRLPLGQIKTLFVDPAELDAGRTEVKDKYKEYFGG